MKAALGLDSSNYRSSAALFGENVKHKRELLPVKSGQLGLRQSDAVFLQNKILPQVVERLFDEIGNEGFIDYDVTCVAASGRPRDLSDSYMPCFLVGDGMAKSIAAVLKKPYYSFSHQAGHIAAAVYSSGRKDLLNSKFIAFHVSGGTTEALLVTPSDNVFSIKIIAKTLDLNAGQAIDRVGQMLGLDFPAGPALEELALRGESSRVKPALKGCDCCLSGLENLCRNKLSIDSEENIARFAIDYIAETIVLMCEGLKKKYGEMPLLFSGGVMANSIIRKRLSTNFEANFGSAELSGDNAVGIAFLAALKNGDNI